MASGIEVAPEALRRHAAELMAIRERFAAVKQASAAIAQADDAYGQLCQFLPPILEDRHNGQDEAVEVLEENLQLLAEAVKGCADLYEEADESAAADFERLADM